jgi:SAM-dependent MidA family methyltransferase
MADVSFLTAHLASRIQKEGPLSFASFMREALYHPTHGYYAVPDRRIGRSGDFYTSISVGSLYGRLLADAFASMWVSLHSPKDWVIVEQGCHDAMLARDVLVALRAHHPAAYAACRWCLVESRAAWRQVQRVTLTEDCLVEKVVWRGMDGEDWQPAKGVFFSNELVDAFPVERMVWRAGSWHTSCVDWNGREFIWVEKSPSPEMQKETGRLPEICVDGHVVEIPTEARSWVKSWSDWLESGYVVTVDYGDAHAAWHAMERPSGTLRAYHEHQVSSEVLEKPGARDITAHVDFSVLVDEGRREGWMPVGWMDQHRFLVGIAEQGWLQGMESTLQKQPTDPEAAAQLRQFRSLMHPEIMGSAFRVLVQARGADAAALSGVAGLKHARPFPESEPLAQNGSH